MVDNKDNRRWLVWIDDSPILPERPLTLTEAISLFENEIADDPDSKVDLYQCGTNEIEWAGVEGRGYDQDDGDAP